ncbi:MAG: GDSL-type esterase/lipase family protein [Clostridiales bacterium]|nr:GDSL-type esterase/lipase family protein [Clostridiales bacterium]
MKKKIFAVFLAAFFSVSALTRGTALGDTGAAAVTYTKPIPDMPVYDSETDSFFENSVFCGDSLMQGFEMYCQYRGEGFLSDPLFLAAASFSLKQAIGPVTSSTLHPLYQGEKLSVEDSIAKCGAEKAFLFYGMNDLVWTEPEDAVEEYNTLIFRIHNKAPDAKIYIIGATYIYAPAQRFSSGYTNENMRIFNDTMYKYCQNYDYIEFINIGDRLIDETNGLRSEYTSDNYVHMTMAGYDVWVKVLRAYARDFTADE